MLGTSEMTHNLIGESLNLWDLPLTYLPIK